MGRSMAALPIPPRHARLLLEVAADERAAVRINKHGKRVADDSGAADAARPIAYAVALTAAVSVEQPFVHSGSAATDEEGEDGRAAAQQTTGASRAAVREAHRALRGNGRSDALSAMAALLAFEAAGGSAEFCAASGLHFRHLQEAAALRRQLAHYLARSRADWAVHDLLPAAQNPHPDNPIVDMLRRGAAAGWADQVARRVKRWEAVQTDTSNGKRNRAVRYISARSEEAVFLHPNSALHASCPDYVVFKELVRTVKRPYMAVVTEVEAGWLADASPFLCTLSDEAVQEPPPAYRPDRDAVLAWHTPSYGRHGWELPLHAVPYRHPRLAAAAFAAALLAGDVLPCLAQLGPELAAPAKWAAKPENQAQKRVGQLVGALESAGVCSRAALARKWSAQPSFLRSELADWLRKGRGTALLDGLWPTALAEAALPDSKLSQRRKKARKMRRA